MAAVQYPRGDWQAHRGPNGWYVARTNRDGGHIVPLSGGIHSTEGNAWRAWRREQTPVRTRAA